MVGGRWIARQAYGQALILAGFGQAAVILLGQPDFLQLGRCLRRRRIQGVWGCKRDGQDGGKQKQARAKNQADINSY